MTFNNFLSGIPARDYIFQKTPYEEQIKQAVELIQNADSVLIGAGAGASTAAGLNYGGKRFRDNFKEFIERYGVQDMYSAGFYPFQTEEERWGYWSKHAYVNRIEPNGLPLYCNLFEMMKDKGYFVLTTNVDHQFQKAGFAEERIFATQGDYGLIQCMNGCHPKTYDAEKLFTKMNQVRYECRIPSEMVPKCPVCGGKMAMNLRCDQYFVEDENWHKADERFGEFLPEHVDEKLVLLELGVGFNTPTIIRFPFEHLIRQHKNISLIRLNLDEAVIPESLEKQAIGINADMKETIDDLCKELGVPYES
ncbi:MAG: Sir2 family NAD-dependent protein deacetylase [bacterium]|nr:Sir2 family NAD-dependent protein deacetylase [bacterium]